MNLQTILGIAQGVGLVMGITFFTYVVMIVVPYVRRTPIPPGDSLALEWHFMVPCRDEEAVIGGTIEYLRTTFPHAHVWIIDDDSDDRTADVVRFMRRGRGRVDRHIHLVQRYRPYARSGKGDALNAAYHALWTWMGRHADADRAIVVVVDADGRPAPNCLDVCAADHLFGDPAVGAVQVKVRMINRGVPDPGSRGLRKQFGMLLVRMQDMEFRTAISAIQLSRKHTGTIALGGNGQFTRLSALDSIAGEEGLPWRGSLLEDFELGVHLLTAGWKTGYSMDTYVDQEALYDPRRFLTQRTRWGQGVLQCIRYVPKIWNSPHLSTVGALEMLYYLAQPWMQLIGSAIYPVPLVLLLIEAIRQPAALAAWFGAGGAWLPFTIYALLGQLPFLIWGPIYRARCERQTSLLRCIGYGMAYGLYVFSFYITTWRAFIRLVRGRNGWAKTRRNTEVTGTGPVALDH